MTEPTTKPKRTKLTPEEKERRRWERSAERDRDRQMKRHPLFIVAGVVKLQSSDERRARHEAGLLLSAQRYEANRLALEAKLAAARAKVVEVATPEQLAAIETRLAGFPALLRPELYDDAFLELTGQPPRTGAVVAYEASRAQIKIGVRAIRAERAKQFDIFEPVASLPTDDRRARGDDPIPGEEAFVVKPAPPCPDCGWDRTAPVSALAFNIHPPTCPTFRGLLLGMSEACADCKGLPRGCCAAHRARVVACDELGVHVPHWPTKGYRSLTGHPFCSRCDASLPVAA